MISVADLPAEAAGYTVSDMAGLPVYTKGSEQIMLLNFGISMPMEEWAMGAEVTKVADNAGCFFAEGVQMCVVATEEFGDVQMSSSGSDITPLVEALAEHFR
ncbi:MAG: hypothetical protein Q4G70_05100 [Pseudomonadota bacterium]|nr:hypothetical protein [Pseudomonadota bacterium]